jgi:hypothetical protein
VPSQCGTRWDIVHGCQYRPGHAGKHRCWCNCTPRRKQPGYGVQMSARARWRLVRGTRRRDERRAAEERHRTRQLCDFVTNLLGFRMYAWQAAVIAHA